MRVSWFAKFPEEPQLYRLRAFSGDLIAEPDHFVLVPEPSTVALLLLGMVGSLAIMRGRKRPTACR